MNAERVLNFNNTTGAISWNRQHAGLHPDACKCNLSRDNYPGTPHKHRSTPPHSCARCDCQAYDPIHPAPDFVNDNYRALIELEKLP